MNFIKLLEKKKNCKQRLRSIPVTNLNLMIKFCHQFSIKCLLVKVMSLVQLSLGLVLSRSQQIILQKILQNQTRYILSNGSTATETKKHVKTVSSMPMAAQFTQQLLLVSFMIIKVWHSSISVVVRPTSLSVNRKMNLKMDILMISLHFAWVFHERS